MKSFAILAATFAGVAYTQDLPQPEGQCAQMCATNMAQIARSQFSCGDNDLACFCNESNWAYGIRDCSNEACEPAEAMSAQMWAAARCAGVAETGAQTPAGLPILTSAIASMPPGNNNPQGTIITTSVATAVVPVTSLASSASSVIASAASSLSDEFASVTDSVASDLSTAIVEGTETTNVVDSVTSALASETAAEEASAAQMTAAPYIAGLGLAAWLLV